MNDEKKIQELFDSFYPMLTDSEQFNQRLERKLALIDEIRRAQAAQIHHYCMAMVIAFVVSIIIGGGLFFFILSTPTDMPLFTFGINSYPLLFIEHNSWLISALLISLMIAFSIVTLLNFSDLVNRLKAKDFYLY